MKAIFLILTLLISPLCSAENIQGINDYACLHLHVSIKNETANTCYLLTEELTNESILNPEHDITFKILPNTETPIIDILPRDYAAGASLELVYECGEGAYIRLDSEKNTCGNQNTIEASVLYAANLTATAVSTQANYWTNKPAKVTWTLK
ncbi:MAG: hypothetical protein ACO1N3_00200 [Gammaproteobacteria bacterium]